MTVSQKRLSGLKSISATLDLGNGISVASVESEITGFETQLNNYNSQLSDVDKRLNEVNQAEKLLSQLNRRILQAVGSAYGYDSNEYEMVGGIRNSERRKPRKGRASTQPTTPEGA